MPKQTLHQHIAILDFGSQYTHLIARRLREARVLARIYPHNKSAQALKTQNPIGMILSGGPNSVHNQTALAYDALIFTLNLPILGLCYGHQLIAKHFGGKVKPKKIREYGLATLSIKPISPLLQNLPNRLTVWMSHGDSVIKLPTGFSTIGKTGDCPIAAFSDEKRRIYGLQFHPEVHHTKDDNQILKNFAFTICKAHGDWLLKNVIKEIEKNIVQQARTKKVFMLVSGGVDSTVGYALLQKTLGKSRVVGLHIDSGLMRKGESANVIAMLKKAELNNLHIFNAEEEFLARLKGIADPEHKRRIIGKTYLAVAERFLKNALSNRSHSAWLLGQGTIYPDTIESGGTKAAHIIKTHHNRIQKIQEMIQKKQIIEPLKNFYKDEVRAIGNKLNISQKLLARHPFPGPGLGIMTMCSQKNIRVPRLLLPKNATILPIKSTGVQGDQRSYAYPVAIWGKTNWRALEKLSIDLTNKNPIINRVVKTVWTKKGIEKPIKFIHAQNRYITRDRLELLRDIHNSINEIMQKYGLYKLIWEFPIILLPIGINDSGQSIVLRPISSNEAMTVEFFRLPDLAITRIVQQVCKHSEIDALFYDVTNKPPATIQWE